MRPRTAAYCRLSPGVPPGTSATHHDEMVSSIAPASGRHRSAHPLLGPSQTPQPGSEPLVAPGLRVSDEPCQCLAAEDLEAEERAVGLADVVDNVEPEVRVLRRLQGPAAPRAERTSREAVVGELLDLVSLRAGTLATVIGQVAAPPSLPDRLRLARIERERDAALARCRRDRDGASLELNMRRLDAEEAEAAAIKVEAGVPPRRAVAWLRELGTGWRALASSPGTSGVSSPRHYSRRSKSTGSDRWNCASRQRQSHTASRKCCRPA